MKCYACGYEVDSKYGKCPNCGFTVVASTGDPEAFHRMMTEAAEAYNRSIGKYEQEDSETVQLEEMRKEIELVKSEIEELKALVQQMIRKEDSDDTIPSEPVVDRQRTRVQSEKNLVKTDFAEKLNTNIYDTHNNNAEHGTAKNAFGENNNVKSGSLAIKKQHVALPVKHSMQLNVGDFVDFGFYYNKLDSGREPLQWIVLHRKGNRYLLITRDGVDCQKFNLKIKLTTVPWEKSSLRFWLNTIFYDQAFSAADQTMIVDTINEAEENPVYKIAGGNDTEDRVFLLSIAEVEQYMREPHLRNCNPTQYAISKGAYVFEGQGEWWLRTPGRYRNDITYVNVSGEIDYSGCPQYAQDMMVRPAIWVELPE